MTPIGRNLTRFSSNSSFGERIATGINIIATHNIKQADISTVESLEDSEHSDSYLSVNMTCSLAKISGSDQTQVEFEAQNMAAISRVNFRDYRLCYFQGSILACILQVVVTDLSKNQLEFDYNHLDLSFFPYRSSI